MLDDGKRYYAMDHVEHLRERLLLDTRSIQRTDFGAGSRRSDADTVQNITRNSVSSVQQCEELFRLIDKIKPKTILELGSSVGISTAYIASACPDAIVYSLEGDPAILSIAQEQIDMLRLGNVLFKEGPFQQTLASTLEEIGTIDCVFLDGHHTYDATLSYFQRIKNYLSPQAIVIVDDIYWSKGMTRAWDTIKKDEDINVSVDLYYYGLLLKNPDLTAQEHYTIIRDRYKPWKKLSAL